MNLSTGTRYAIRILFELCEPGPPVPIALLSEQTGIALKTVEKIHAELKQNGITDAISGPKGGIILLVPLSEISLGRMIAIFDDGVRFAVCYGDKANECPNQKDCLIISAWGNISKMIQQELDSISLWSILQEYPKNSCLFSAKQLFPFRQK